MHQNLSHKKELEGVGNTHQTLSYEIALDFCELTRASKTTKRLINAELN